MEPYYIAPVTFHWSPQRMDQLERAVRDGRRVLVVRRGSEFVVFARRVETRRSKEIFVGILPMTGDEIVFELGQVEDFQVI